MDDTAKSPGRRQAERDGSGNFAPDPDYDHAGGFPKGTPGQGGEPRGTESRPASTEAPAAQPKPFALGE